MEMTRVIEAAMDAAGEGITIANIEMPDQPLIYVNQGFEKLTGYTKAEIMGRNCRFLQGNRSSGNSLEVIRQAMRDFSGCTVELLNYRKDQTVFWNRLTLAPVVSEGVRYMIGVQMDITKEKSSIEHLRNLSLALLDLSEIPSELSLSES